MNCLRPIWINLKIPKIDHATGEIIRRIQVPCSRCEACLERRRLDWFVRLKIEHQHSVCSYFVTLTYDEAHLPVTYDDDDREVLHFDKPEIQRFLKRLRGRLSPTKFRYFLISEYGENTYRSHYHIHFFFPELIDQDCFLGILDSCWTQGGVHIEESVDGTMNYVCGHVQFINDVPPGYDRPFSLSSRNPGIGAQLLENYIKISSQSDVSYLYFDEEGRKFNLPRYYRDRIYTLKSKDDRRLYLEKFLQETPKQLQDDFAKKIRKRKKQRLARGL